VKPLGDLEYYSVYEFVQDYKEGHLSRREMMRRVLYIAGGVASAASILSLMGCGGQAAPSVAPASSAAPKPAASAAASAKPAASASAKPAASAAASAAAASKPAASASAKPAASGSAAAKPAASQPALLPPRSPLSVKADDPAIDGKDVTFPGAGGATIMAYEVRPKSASGALPCVLVCHENLGLIEHIRDVARRYAKEGYLAVAVDLLSREGGTEKMADPARIPSILASPDNVNRHVGDFKSAADYYSKQNFVKQGAIGMNGFCFGGGITWRAAEELGSALKAAVPFYGAPPPLDKVKDIKAAVFGVYSSDPNDFANNNRDQLESALKAANVTYQFKVYPGTQHAFHADVRPVYNQEQALAAWKDTLDWFGKYLKA